MPVKQYGFGSLVLRIDSPAAMKEDPRFEAFAVDGALEPDYTFRIMHRPCTADSRNERISTRRAGREILVYMDAALLPEITISNFLCSAGMAELLPETGRFILHASYVLLQGQAILFTAPSQTGKSTQAHFWTQYRGAQIINEDRVIISHRDGVYYANGCWAMGSAQVCRNVTAPIRGIVLLSQGPENRVSYPPAFEKLQRLIPQCTFDARSVDGRVRIIDAVSAMIDCVPILAFACVKDPTGVEELERYL